MRRSTVTLMRLGLVGLIGLLGFVAVEGGAAEFDAAGAADSLEQAWRLLHSGNASAAAEQFQERLAERDDDAEAAEGRIRALLAMDRWQQALAEAREIDTRQPSRPRVVAALAEALFRAGRLAEASERLDAMQSRGHARALWTQSRLLGAAGQFENAVERIELAL